MNGYLIGPAHRKKLLMGLRVSQVTLIGTGLLVVFIGFIAGFLIPSLVFVAATVGLAFMPIGGRVIDEWVPVMINWFLRNMRGQRKVQTASALVGSTEANRRPGAPPIFQGVKLLKVGVGDGNKLGIIKDTTQATYSAVISLRGDAFALLDQSEQEHRLNQWASILASFAREGTPVYRIQWIERAFPEDGDEVARYYESERTLGENDPIASAYEELVSEAGPVTTNHDIFVVISVHQGKSSKAIKAAGGGDEGACEVLLQELNSLYAHLASSNVQLTGAMTPEEVALMFRVGFEPNRVRELTHQSHEGLLGSADIWPSAIEEEWSHIRTDSSYHATLWVSDWPRVEVGADFFAPLLLHTHATRAICLIMEPLQPSKAFHEVEMAKTTMMADSEIKSKAGFMINARNRQEFDQLERREQELTEGHGPYRFTAFVVCSGETLEALNRTIGEVEQAGHRSRILLRRLYGEQASAMTVAFPLGRGLK